MDVRTFDWKENPDATRVVASAKHAIKHILSMEAPVIEEHKKSLISRMLWKVTEAHGKYTTRYFSEKALTCTKHEQRHDHVWTRRKMVQSLIDNPMRLDEEINRAIACIVTKEEHRKLSEFDASYDGWERYKMAKIRVWDRKDNTQISDAYE